MHEFLCNNIPLPDFLTCQCYYFAVRTKGRNCRVTDLYRLSKSNNEFRVVKGVTVGVLIPVGVREGVDVFVRLGITVFVEFGFCTKVGATVSEGNVALSTGVDS